MGFRILSDGDLESMQVFPCGPLSASSDHMSFSSSDTAGSPSPSAMAMLGSGDSSGECTPQPTASPRFQPQSMAIRRLPPAKARHQPVLPAPLTDEIIQTAMPELSEGTRRALETCYSCFKVRFSVCALHGCLNASLSEGS